MTNEEAIKKLKAVQAEFNGNWIDYGGINQAFEKAYQALDERPQGEWLSVLSLWGRYAERRCRRMNNKAHLRPQDYDSNGDIIPMACKEEKGDLISRRDIKDHISELMLVYSGEELANAILNAIDNAPTVEPFEKIGSICEENCGYRPQGEWTIGYTAKQKKVAVCNLCNCISFQGKTNFCHNCGAKMQKGGAE